MQRLLDQSALVIPTANLSDPVLPPFFAARFGWGAPPGEEGGMARRNVHLLEAGSALPVPPFSAETWHLLEQVSQAFSQ